MWCQQRSSGWGNRVTWDTVLHCELNKWESVGQSYCCNCKKKAQSLARNLSNVPSARPSGIAARNARLRRGKQGTRKTANAPQCWPLRIISMRNRHGSTSSWRSCNHHYLLLYAVFVQTVVRRRRVAVSSSNVSSARLNGIAAKNVGLRRGISSFSGKAACLPPPMEHPKYFLLVNDIVD